ncbi:MAG: hypothetical protein ABJG47_00640 [Ekhidna sp.]
MKLSNKLLIGFFGGAMVYMLLAFTEVRLRGDDRRLTGENATVESQSLSGIRYIKLNDIGKRIYISSSDTSRIEMRSKDGNVLSGLRYKISGDTLTLNQLELDEDVRVSLTIFISKSSFTGLHSNEARVYFSDLDLPIMAIIQSGGNIVFENNIYLDRLLLQASANASFRMHNGEIDTVTLNMDNSDATIRSRIGRLEGYMANKSDLFAGSVNDIEFKKDKSSSMRLID